MKNALFHAAAVMLVAASIASAADLSPDDALARRRTPVVTVFEHARNSVVNISSTHIVRVDSPFGFDSLLDDFFNCQSRGRVRQYR